MKLSYRFMPVAVITALATTQSIVAKNSNTMIITANRFEQGINDTLANVEVISREDIERIQPESINDLLLFVSGLDVVTQGGSGQISAVFARGSSPDHTLILIDGVRVGSATDGRKSLSSISVAQIESIEIIKGPRASVWGSDAIGAVIHIRTRSMNNGEQSASLTAGSLNYRAGHYLLGFGNDKLNHSFTVASESSDGFDVFSNATNTLPDSEPDNDGYRRVSATLRGKYQLSDELKLNWVMQGNQGNGEYDNAWGANESDFKDHFWNTRYDYTTSNWFSNLSVGQSRDHSVSYGNGIALVDGSIFETRRNQAHGALGYQIEGFRLASGLEQYKDNVNGATGFTKTRRTTLGGYLLASANWDKTAAEISLRHDDVDDVGSDLSFSVSAGVSLSEKWRLSASRGKGFKAPTFNDLYYPASAFFGGNPDLQSEVSYSNEVNLRYQSDNHLLKVSRFQSNFSNLIAFEYDSNFVLRPYNIERAVVNGYEVDYRLTSGDFFHQLGLSYNNVYDVSFDPFTNTITKTPLIRRAKRGASYSFGWTQDRWSLSAQIIHKGKRPDNDYSVYPEVPVTLERYTQINLAGNYQFNERLALSVKLNDVDDAEPVQVNQYQSAGAQNFVTVSYKF